MMKYLTRILLPVLFVLPNLVFANAGITLVSSGDVSATQEGADGREVKRRSKIFETDTVTTGPNSRAQFRMKDGAMVALTENSEWQVLEYSYQEAEEDAVAMKLLKGGLRTISGQVGKADNSQYKLDTPVGSIGIRGTHYEVRISAGGELLLAVYEGTIVAETEQGMIELGAAAEYSYASIDASGNVTYYENIPEEFSEGHSLSKAEIERLVESGAVDASEVSDALQRLSSIDSFNVTEKPEEPLENNADAFSDPQDQEPVVNDEPEPTTDAAASEAEIILDFNDIVN
jgi:hypothetical protein